MAKCHWCGEYVKNSRSGTCYCTNNNDECKQRMANARPIKSLESSRDHYQSLLQDLRERIDNGLEQKKGVSHTPSE